MGKQANQLSDAIRDFLTLTGWMVCKNMSGVSSDRSGNYFEVGEKGRCDMEAHKAKPGGGCYWLAIEVKAGKDRLRPAQSEWLGKAAAHGAHCIVAKSCEDVEKRLEEL